MYYSMWYVRRHIWVLSTVNVKLSLAVYHSTLRTYIHIDRCTYVGMYLVQ